MPSSVWIYLGSEGFSYSLRRMLATTCGMRFAQGTLFAEGVEKRVKNPRRPAAAGTGVLYRSGKAPSRSFQCTPLVKGRLRPMGPKSAPLFGYERLPGAQTKGP